MSSKIKYQIFTGPLEEDWLVAELYYEDEHLADIGEWGEKILIHPRIDGKSWNLSIDDLIDIIQSARIQVSREMMRKTDQDKPIQ